MASTVSPRTYRSYCSVTQLLSARPGEPIRASRSARSAGAVRRAGQRRRVVGGQRVLTRGPRQRPRGRPGRRPRSRAGCPTTVSPCQVMTSRPVSVTSPITAARTSHLAQTARNSSTRPGSTTAIMRSCDSLIKISGGPSEASRSGTASSLTRMPPVPGRGQLRGRAGHPGRAEVLDADHQAAREQLEAALDQQFLHERVPHLHAGPLDRLHRSGRRRTPRWPAPRPRRRRPGRSPTRTGSPCSPARWPRRPAGHRAASPPRRAR